jgi:DNA-binding response OmpR family regulator
VVDDEDAIRLTISMVLARRGHEVVGARDAAEGHVRAHEGRFDVALVDLRLPGNGLTLLAELEATAALAGRTVLVTGSCDVLAETELWPRWLAKPFDYDELIALVEAMAE